MIWRPHDIIDISLSQHIVSPCVCGLLENCHYILIHLSRSVIAQSPLHQDQRLNCGTVDGVSSGVPHEDEIILISECVPKCMNNVMGSG